MGGRSIYLSDSYASQSAMAFFSAPTNQLWRAPQVTLKARSWLAIFCVYTEIVPEKFQLNISNYVIFTFYIWATSFDTYVWEIMMYIGQHLTFNWKVMWLSLGHEPNLSSYMYCREVSLVYLARSIAYWDGHYIRKGCGTFCEQTDLTIGMMVPSAQTW